RRARGLSRRASWVRLPAAQGLRQAGCRAPLGTPHRPLPSQAWLTLCRVQAGALRLGGPRIGARRREPPVLGPFERDMAPVRGLAKLAGHAGELHIGKGEGWNEAMNFDFSDDLQELREQARKFLRERCSCAVVRRVLEGPEPYDKGLWGEIAA